MFKTIEWGQNRYKPMVIAAHTVALGAAECHELIVRARQGLVQADSRPGSISLSTWLECYRRPSIIEAGVLQGLFAVEQVDESANFQQEWRRGRRQFFAELRRCRPNERDAKWGQRWWNVAYRVHIREVKNILAGREELPEHLGAWISKPEVVFFLSVAAPCWLEFGCWPVTLLQQARMGEFAALEKLLRLDANVSGVRHIADQLLQIKATNPDRHRLLMEAAAKGRTKTVTREDVKCSLSGLLSRWSNEWEQILRGELEFDLMPRFALPGHEDAVQRWIRQQRKRRQRERHGCALSVPAIRQLLDAVACDKGQGLVDPDLPQGDEAFRKRVQRNASLWPTLRNWDKISAA